MQKSVSVTLWSLEAEGHGGGSSSDGILPYSMSPMMLVA